MPLSYFEQVSLDFKAIGFAGERLDPKGWPGLHDLLWRTTEISPKVLERVDATALHLRTPIGKAALELMIQDETDITFMQECDLICCNTAEGILLDALTETNLYDRRVFSPLIVTLGGRPAGIIKTIGEKSCYALTTDLASGLVETCFVEPSPALRELAVQTSSSTHAWSLPMEETGGFKPLRFSAFSLPVEERSKLFSEWAQEVLTTSHQAIMEQAEALLDEAVPLAGMVE